MYSVVGLPSVWLVVAVDRFFNPSIASIVWRGVRVCPPGPNFLDVSFRESSISGNNNNKQELISFSNVDYAVRTGQVVSFGLFIHGYKR